MHIAVCDDNIADRKQTERLLGRQSDRFFKETGERLYIDSYGNVPAFMNYPQMYDGLFVDMRNEEPTGFEIAKKLIIQHALYKDQFLRADSILNNRYILKVAKIQQYNTIQLVCDSPQTKMYLKCLRHAFHLSPNAVFFHFDMPLFSILGEHTFAYSYYIQLCRNN